MTLISGPRSTVPSLLRLAFGKNITIWSILRDFQNRFGDIVKVTLPFREPLLLVSDPDIAGRVLIGSEKISSKGMIVERMKIFLGDGLFTSKGDKWRSRRRLLNPMFHSSQIDTLAVLIQSEILQMCDRWESQLGSSDIIDLSDEMAKLTFSIISKAMFSTEPSKKTHALHKLMADAQRMANAFNFAPFLLPLWVPTPFNLKVRRISKLFDSITNELIQEHKSHPDRYKDLLTLLLNSRDADTGASLSELEIRDELVTTLISGHETTSSTLSMGLEALSHEPQVLAKMRAEYEGLDENNPLNYKSLKYSKQVINEIIRLYPAIWAIERVMLEDLEVKGFTLKKSDHLLLLPYLTHRHPKLWDNPDSFDPERFSEVRSQGRHPFAYYPFGGGARACIGVGLAKMEIEICLWQIVKRFDLLPLEGFHYTPMARVTTSPQPNIKLRIAKRSP